MEIRRLGYFIIAAIIEIVWCLHPEISKNNPCDYLKNCSCFPYQQYYEIQCDHQNVTLYLSPDKYDNNINIECNNQNVYLFVPNIVFNVESVTVTYCILPEINFKSVLQKINITHLKQLYLNQQNSLSNKEETFFKGLESLEVLNIKSASGIFQQNLFNRLPNLRELYLERNQLIHVGYLFEKNSKLKYLYLSKNSIKTLPSGVFNKLSDLERLHLLRNNLTNITQNYFTGLKKLQSLELSSNSIRYLEEDAFSELPELVNISLKSNKLGNIQSSLFKHNHKIEHIRIGDNLNLIISDFVFANLENLKSINMDHCGLIDIPEHTFENCTNLIILEIENNKLKSIHSKLFRTLKKLNILNLNKNQLSTLPDNIFASLENLENLYLEDNIIVSISDNPFKGLKKLKHLTLKNNQISKIDGSTFSNQINLVTLDLSYNELMKENNIFSELKRLKYLLLGHNKIFEFPKILITSNNLERIDLSHNNLNSIDIKSLINVSKYAVTVNLIYNNITYINFVEAEKVANDNLDRNTILYISNNPIRCDCNNLELTQYLNGNMHSAVKTFTEIIVEDTYCFGPEALKTRYIRDVYPKEIICEFSKDCPSVCKCFLRPVDSARIVDCSFKNLTYLPNLTLKDQRIEVNMVGNLLESGPSDNQGYKMVKNLFLSNNTIKNFNWSPPYIEVLKLDHNHLKLLHSDVLDTLNNSTNFSELTLENNKWSCGCSALDLQNFIKSHFKKFKRIDVICEEEKIPLIDIKEICKSRITIFAQILIPLLALFSILAIMSALYFRYKQEVKIWLFSNNLCMWFVTEEELDKDKTYDVFLSFSHKDEDFAFENLIPILEKSFKLCIHSRDWLAGETINKQIFDSVQNSRRTVILLSNNFLESAWGQLEFLMAHKQSLEERRPTVIVIKFGELNSDKISNEIQGYMQTNTYVEWGKPWFWKKLLYALPHSSTNSSRIDDKHVEMMLNIDSNFELVSQPLNSCIISNITASQVEVPLMKIE